MRAHLQQFIVWFLLIHVEYIGGICLDLGAPQVALVVRNPPANAGDSIPGFRRSPGGNGNLLQYPCLKNSLGREAWRPPVPLGCLIVYSAKDLGVCLRLRDLSRNKVLFLFHFYWLQIRGRICYQSLYITLAFIRMSSYPVLWTVLHRILSDFTGKEMEAQAGSWLA